MNGKAIELVIALVVAAVFAALFSEAQSYSAQSKMMPMAVTGLAVALSLIWAFQCGISLVRHGSGERLPAGDELGRLATIIAAVVVYILCVQYLGFFTATIVMIPLLSGLVGYRNWRISLLVTAGFVVVLYAVFRLLLSIPLPPETLLEVVIG